MAYPDDKEDFTPPVSPEHIRDNHVEELQTLLETLQDIIGLFPTWQTPPVADIGDCFIDNVRIRMTHVYAKDTDGLYLVAFGGGMGLHVNNDGNVGVKTDDPSVELDVNGEIKGTYGFYHDRGDPDSYDFELGDLTEDNAWHTLDLSGIVPADTKGVALFVMYKASGAGQSIVFRKNGNFFTSNRSMIVTAVADIFHTQDIIVSCDTDRFVEYKMSSPQTVTVRILVKGWWK